MAAEPTSKPSPPDAATVKEALVTVNEVYRNDIAKAKTADERASIVGNLIAAAKEEKDATARFALLSKAQDVAAEGGDYDGASAALDAMDAAFDVDVLRMKLDTATATGRMARNAEQKSRLAAAISELVDQSIAAERYDIAKSAADVGLTVAWAGADTATIQDATAKVQQVREIATAYEDAKKARAVLDQKPTDPDASLIVGKFLCFFKDNWENGLPMLAMGNDPALKGLAVQEALGPKGVDEQVKLGDKWWSMATQLTGPAQDAVQAHAAVWYRTALPNLSGLAKAKVDKRVQSLPQGVIKKPQSKPSMKPFQCRVVSATYGAGKRSQVDVTGRVSKLLAAKHKQVIAADNTVLVTGDPAPGVKKTLTVTLDIAGQTVILSVPDGRMLGVWPAGDARTADDMRALSPPTARKGQKPFRIRGTSLNLVAAVYGVDARTADVTERIADLLQAGGSVHVTDTEMAVPDPAWGVVKSLTIELDVEGHDVIVLVQDSGQVTLRPAP